MTEVEHICRFEEGKMSDHIEKTFRDVAKIFYGMPVDDIVNVVQLILLNVCHEIGVSVGKEVAIEVYKGIAETIACNGKALRKKLGVEDG